MPVFSAESKAQRSFSGASVIWGDVDQLASHLLWLLKYKSALKII